MADYFTYFSLILPLPTESARKYALDLAHQAACLHPDDEMPDDFPASLREAVEDWQFETEAEDPSDGCGIWLHSEYGGVDAVCAFIQHLLHRFDPEGCTALEWSNDCSRRRVDAYGGGAAIVTAKGIKSITTREWLQRQLARLNIHVPGQHAPAHR
jgi:hypothetical protein